MNGNSSEVENLKKLKIKSVIDILKEVKEEYTYLTDLLIETGFTGIDDNYKIRQRLNSIIHEMRKAQDVVIKIKSSNKKK